MGIYPWNKFRYLTCEISVFFPSELLLHNYKWDGYVPCCATVNTHTIVNCMEKFREMLLTILAYNQHDVIDVIWKLPVWNVKIRRYLASCTLQFWSNLTKIIFQGKHFDYFIVVGWWRHVFWSDTHYSISLRYTRNIVQLKLILY